MKSGEDITIWIITNSHLLKSSNLLPYPVFAWSMKWRLGSQMSFAPPELKLEPFKISCLQKKCPASCFYWKRWSRKVLKETTLILIKFEWLPTSFEMTANPFFCKQETSQALFVSPVSLSGSNDDLERFNKNFFRFFLQQAMPNLICKVHNLI